MTQFVEINGELYKVGKNTGWSTTGFDGQSNSHRNTGWSMTEYSRQNNPQPSLKSCPCCGSTRIHVVAPDDGCYCWDCGLTMPNRPNWRERWNRRVKE